MKPRPRHKHAYIAVWHFREYIRHRRLGNDIQTNHYGTAKQHFKAIFRWD